MINKIIHTFRKDVILYNYNFFNLLQFFFSQKIHLSKLSDKIDPTVSNRRKKILKETVSVLIMAIYYT